MRYRLPVFGTALLFGALPLLALTACAQPAAEGSVRFRQAVADGYAVEIRVAPPAACAEDAPLFRTGGDSPFQTVRPADPCDAPAETLVLLQDDEVVDTVGAHRLWLGAPPDSLMWEGLAPEDHPVPGGAVRDLTGDGVPELLIGAWSGGAHCCFGYLVVELGDAPRVLADIASSDSEVAVEDRDGDGTPELWLYDFAFAYWNESFAGSPAPDVGLVWDGDGFTASPAAMRQPDLTPDSLAALAAAVRAEPSWAGDRAFPPTAYWATLLDLLYSGRGAQATQFAERAWPGDKLGRSVFLAWFGDQLIRSPYADAVREMNRDTWAYF